MKINSEGINLIKEFEGFRSNFYNDSVGKKTIGYGHNCEANGEDGINPPITQEEGEELLMKDIAMFERAVDKETSGLVNSNQFSALVSFTFNLGQGNFRKSTLLKKIKEGDINGASDEFEKWVFSGGKKSSGLVRRREAERQLFLK
ncbi:Glycoside Hydrolase Family 24 protein [Glomus cerebriforme]|uniref:Glycoside Hydrolase Family 24 protein n=1 Tax=Glomus cerebriforme TaxID=658196 RepID=A0A397TH16_9GLOM|nr:Glycoside Hydrolase Family 24 protein [Glomus cerebriforme]